jgi:mannose-6-phosphate isomerase
MSEKMELYPLKFEPRYVPKMWGGRKIQTVLGKPLPAGELIGESWELFDFPPGAVEGTSGWVSAAVANGPLAGRTLHELVGEFGPALLGDVPLSQPGGQFPILIKFLDARQDLSVQVHPDKKYAQANAGAFLKSEAWYVVQADAGAKLYKGLTPGVTREAFAAAIESRTVESMIRTVPVKPGQCYYLPSGTIHALGAGLLVAEVQTPSDTTYRVHDFDRIDPSTGKARKLHVAQALECIDFSGADSGEQARSHVAGFSTTVTSLVKTEYFQLEKIRVAEGVVRPVPYEQPVVWIVLEGSGQVSTKAAKEPTSFSRGDTVLLPARMPEPTLSTQSDCVWLEVTFPI